MIHKRIYVTRKDEDGEKSYRIIDFISLPGTSVLSAVLMDKYGQLSVAPINILTAEIIDDYPIRSDKLDEENEELEDEANYCEPVVTYKYHIYHKVNYDSMLDRNFSVYSLIKVKYLDGEPLSKPVEIPRFTTVFSEADKNLGQIQVDTLNEMVSEGRDPLSVE